jgi:hypothetical protein
MSMCESKVASRVSVAKSRVARNTANFCIAVDYDEMTAPLYTLDKSKTDAQGGDESHQQSLTTYGDHHKENPAPERICESQHALCG